MQEAEKGGKNHSEIRHEASIDEEIKGAGLNTRRVPTNEIQVGVAKSEGVNARHRCARCTEK